MMIVNALPSTLHIFPKKTCERGNFCQSEVEVKKK